MNSVRDLTICSNCGYYPLSISCDRCPKCRNNDPFEKKASLNKRNKVVGSIMLIVAFIFSVFFLFPFLEIQYNKITQNGKVPIHFLPLQNKAPN